MIRYKGEIFHGTHEPLVSKKLFDKVQEVIRDKGKPQKVKIHNFLFLGLIKCPCSATITAEKKIKPSGKEYVYYRCTKKKGPCPEKYFLRQEELYSQIKSFLQKVSLSWLEPARKFVLSLNQAAKLLESENKTEMTTFLKNIGSNCILQNRQLIFSPKIQYKLAAERSEAASKSSTFSEMVDPRGFAPRTRPCHGRVLLLYHGPILFEKITQKLYNYKVIYRPRPHT